MGTTTKALLDFVIDQVEYTLPSFVATNPLFQQEAQEDLNNLKEYVLVALSIIEDNYDPDFIKKTFQEAQETYLLQYETSKISTKDNYVSMVPHLIKTAFTNMENILLSPAYQQIFADYKSSKIDSLDFYPLPKLFHPLLKWCQDKSVQFLGPTSVEKKKNQFQEDLISFKEKFGFHQVLLSPSYTLEESQLWLNKANQVLTNMFNELKIPYEMAGLNGKVSLGYLPNISDFGGLFYSNEKKPFILLIDKNLDNLAAVFKHEYTHLNDFMAGVAKKELEGETQQVKFHTGLYLSHQVVHDLLNDKKIPDSFKGMGEIMSHIISGQPQETLITNTNLKQQQLQENALLLFKAALFQTGDFTNEEYLQLDKALNEPDNKDIIKFFTRDSIFTPLKTDNLLQSQIKSYHILIDNIALLLNLPSTTISSLKDKSLPTTQFLSESISNVSQNMGLSVSTSVDNAMLYFSQSQTAHKSLQVGFEQLKINHKPESVFYQVRLTELLARWTESTTHSNLAEHSKQQPNYPVALTDHAKQSFNDHVFNLIQFNNQHYKCCPAFNDNNYREIKIGKGQLEPIIELSNEEILKSSDQSITKLKDSLSKTILQPIEIEHKKTTVIDNINIMRQKSLPAPTTPHTFNKKG
jgi:hypothetical protein